MREKEELRPTKHRSRSFEDLEKEVHIEGVGEGQGYRGTWCLPREWLSRDVGGPVERALPCGYEK